MHVSLSAASSFPTQSFLSHLIPPLSQANTNMSCFVHFAISSSHHTLSSIKFPPKVLSFFLSQTHTHRNTQTHTHTHTPHCKFTLVSKFLLINVNDSPTAVFHCLAF